MQMLAQQSSAAPDFPVKVSRSYRRHVQRQRSQAENFVTRISATLDVESCSLFDSRALVPFPRIHGELLLVLQTSHWMLHLVALPCRDSRAVPLTIFLVLFQVVPLRGGTVSDCLLRRANPNN